ncbi:hypothetical protein [Streptomyces sp. BBFR102]|uniref:hypothetical protein n=1 Tax=Streptomyces sp. BBFR102 TaxID=3448171 RepID=UPI003F5394B3
MRSRTPLALVLVVVSPLATASAHATPTGAPAGAAHAPAAPGARPAGPPIPLCVQPDAAVLPLTGQLRDGPAHVRAGDEPSGFTVRIRNTSRITCHRVHPVVLLLDEDRALAPSQLRLDFHDGRRWLPVRLRHTTRDENVGVLDGGQGFRGFTVRPGAEKDVRLRLAVREDARPNRVAVQAALVQHHDRDGHWVGHSDTYTFALRAADGTGTRPPVPPSPPHPPRSERPADPRDATPSAPVHPPRSERSADPRDATPSAPVHPPRSERSADPRDAMPSAPARPPGSERSAGPRDATPAPTGRPPAVPVPPRPWPLPDPWATEVSPSASRLPTEAPDPAGRPDSPPPVRRPGPASPGPHRTLPPGHPDAARSAAPDGEVPPRDHRGRGREERTEVPGHTPGTGPDHTPGGDGDPRHPGLESGKGRPELAETGGSATSLGLLAAALLTCGAALLRLARRLRRS